MIKISFLLVLIIAIKQYTTTVYYYELQFKIIPKFYKFVKKNYNYY